MLIINKVASVFYFIF